MLKPIPFSKSLLKDGDILLYFSGGSIFDWIIALKTWCKVAHCEFYRGRGLSYASRNGLGVNNYFLRTDGIAAVLRLKDSINLTAVDMWFDTVAGQKYDWLGLLCFTLAVKQGSQARMFCSEFLTRLIRSGHLEPFNTLWDADRVPPSFFLLTPLLELVWQDGYLF